MTMISRHRLLFHRLGSLPQFLRSWSSNSGSIIVSDEVKEAVHSGKAVVALESTIITHGMPHPLNFRTAMEVEEIVRRIGAVPATIGFDSGKLLIGMDHKAIEKLSDPDVEKVKISRRDLSYALSQGRTGGTTTAATMVAANMASIGIFATGGVGGVHRDGHISMDVSADLRELGRTPVTVVSAGIKSILDIGRTLEYLETEGVCVASYNSDCEFPAFFSRTSGYKAPFCVRHPQEAADLIEAHKMLRLSSGILIAVPIPSEDSLNADLVEKATSEATAEAKRKGIDGRNLTPFVLKRVCDLTEGASLRANIALIKNNCKVASEIAVALSHPKKNPSRGSSFLTEKRSGDICPRVQEKNVAESEKPVVIGATNIDFVVQPIDSLKMNGGTVCGEVKMTFGGVGRNVADCLRRLGNDVFFISAVGDDFFGDTIVQRNPKLHRPGTERMKGQTTAVCSVNLNNGKECLFVVADMEIHQQISPQMVSKYRNEIVKAPIVVLDANLSLETIDSVLELCSEADVPVWFEPTDVHKAGKICKSNFWTTLQFASPNVAELRAMHSSAFGTSFTKQNTEDTSLDNLLEECSCLGRDLAKNINTLMVTLGHWGVLLVTNSDLMQPFPLKGSHLCNKDKIKSVYFPPLNDENRQPLVSVSGAGDCLAGAVIASILRREIPETCVKAGLCAAQLSVQSHETVPNSICIPAIYNNCHGDTSNRKILELL